MVLPLQLSLAASLVRVPLWLVYLRVSLAVMQLPLVAMVHPHLHPLVAMVHLHPHVSLAHPVVRLRVPRLSLALHLPRLPAAHLPLLQAVSLAPLHQPLVHLP